MYAYDQCGQALRTVCVVAADNLPTSVPRGADNDLHVDDNDSISQ